MYKAQRGHTTYTLEEEHGFVKLARHNADGETVMFVPVELIAAYAADKLADDARTRVRKNIQEAFGVKL